VKPNRRPSPQGNRCTPSMHHPLQQLSRPKEKQVVINVHVRARLIVPLYDVGDAKAVVFREQDLIWMFYQWRTAAARA